ncbi:MAG: diguanylate cyclase, partial [Gammaproteobacteria bacterium]|nr:diguanylate cyclase [Gammaproteobacteria bacterium]
SQALSVAEKIRAASSAPYHLIVKHAGEAGTTVEHRCSASIGVTLFIDHAVSPDNILKSADDAMYQAKDAGRNTIRIHAAKA